ncbi:MAG: S9 family peptidase [Bacteroidales bacterium]|jgi:dipeptidyl aminopeptidase/acylaminoacyl peptidase|nr:S9 family peptidase [Bacteroidales bacterium]
MEKKLVILMMSVILFSSCNTTNKPQETTGSPAINNELTAEEKEAGLMTPEIMWKFGRLGSFALSPDGKTVLYTVTRTDLATEKSLTEIFSQNTEGGDPVKLTEGGGSSPQWFDEGKKIAFVREGRLMTMNADGSEQAQIDGLDDFESFRISPSDKRIFFSRRVKIDQTANEKHGFEEARVRIINDLMYRHWDSWSDYSYSHIFVASFNGNTVTDEKDIMEGQRFNSPTAPYYEESEIAWSPDSRYLAYTVKRLYGRDDAVSTNTDIILYEISSGKEINISEGNRGYDRYPVFSPDGSKIAYQSMERDGYESDLDRIFVYDRESGSRTWVSRGWDFDAENLAWFNEGTLYFTCAYLGTSQIFKINLSDNRVDKVTEGNHDLGPIRLNSGTLISGIMSYSMAPELAAVDPVSGTIRQVSSINGEIYKHIRMGRSEEKYIRTSDNKDLQMWIVYPPDFDPSVRYPALVFCNGGPQSSLGQFWSYRWNFQMMAAKGYIVIAPNRRGNKGFGQAWKEQISGDYGGANIRDYLDATDAMAGEKYIDSERMGAVGASYGGYSVFYLAGAHAGRYKAFIAHCGMFNFTSWYGTTEELWFPDKDIEGPYWNSPRSYMYSPHLKADEWDTPILIITGANDFRIPYTQSLEAFQAAQLNNIPSRLLFFENETHFVLRPQNSVIWQREFFEWLDSYMQ